MITQNVNSFLPQVDALYLLTKQADFDQTYTNDAGKSFKYHKVVHAFQIGNTIVDVTEKFDKDFVPANYKNEFKPGCLYTLSLLAWEYSRSKPTAQLSHATALPVKSGKL